MTTTILSLQIKTTSMKYFLLTHRTKRDSKTLRRHALDPATYVHHLPTDIFWSVFREGEKKKTLSNHGLLPVFMVANFRTFANIVSQTNSINLRNMVSRFELFPWDYCYFDISNQHLIPVKSRQRKFMCHNSLKWKHWLFLNYLNSQIVNSKHTIFEGLMTMSNKLPR